MDDPSIIFRRLISNSLFQPIESRAHRERRIEPERQTRGQCGAELPSIRLRIGSHHLQLAPNDVAVGEKLRIQSLEIIAAAHDGGIDIPGAAPRRAAGFDLRQIYGVHDRAPMELYAKPG